MVTLPESPGSRTSPAYAKVGWTLNGYKMFSYFYAVDPVFNMDNVAYLVRKVRIPAAR